MEQTSEDQENWHEQYPHPFKWTKEQLDQMEQVAKQLMADAEFEARIKFREMSKD